MPLLTFVDIYNPYVETRSLESTNKASCSQIFSLDYSVEPCNSNKSVKIPYQRAVVLPQSSPFDIFNDENDKLKKGCQNQSLSEDKQNNWNSVHSKLSLNFV